MERATAGAGRCVGGWIEVVVAIGIAEKIDIRVPHAIPLRPDVVGGAQYVADPQGREFRFWDLSSPHQISEKHSDIENASRHMHGG